MKKPMQKIRTCLQKTPNALLCALGAVVFLAGFYFLCYRTPLNEVWLPTTMNNDEALYNRQVVSVLTHGGPQGYFGYQESTADIGRYGTWGPLLIWAYALPGLLFGASVNVVLWCNLLLIAVGIAVFARCARLNYWQCIALYGALFSIMLPLRSCVSGASEAMHYMLALLIVGTAAALHRSGKTGWLIACAAACAVETIFRPYALLFWVFPLTAVWQNKRRRARRRLAAGARRPAAADELPARQPAREKRRNGRPDADRRGRPDRQRAGCRGRPLGPHAGLRL